MVEVAVTKMARIISQVPFSAFCVICFQFVFNLKVFMKDSMSFGPNRAHFRLWRPVMTL